MSYKSMLKHRATVLEPAEINEDGVPVIGWQEVATDVRCFLDLNFIRKGKDPQWTPEAGRPQDRVGVLFVGADAPIKSGHRVLMTRGPAGTFQIEGAVDEAWTPRSRHHIEVGVVEVAAQIARAQYLQPRG